MATATTTKKQEERLDNLIEHKILEFFGDPDMGRTLKRGYLLSLRKQMAQKRRALTSHADVLKKHGIR